MHSGHGVAGQVIAFQNDKDVPEVFFGLYHARRGVTRYIRADSAEQARSFLGAGEVVLPTTFSLISNDK